MKVILAQPRGFCAGVVRAVEIVERAIEKYGNGRQIYVRHEIVHNKHVVDSLRSKGAAFVDDLDDVPAGAVTIFSAHGVGRQVTARASERGLHVIDGTCPLVAKVHHEGRRYVTEGYTVLLIGHAGHPEVIGTMGQIEGPVILVQNQTEAERLQLPQDTRLAYITQTTLSVDDTRDIIESLKSRFPKIVGPDISDICYATQNRQAAVRKLSEQVDLLLVVGAFNSSNSLRLCEIAKKYGVRSFLVENGKDLKNEWFVDIECVGITASASAPEAMVNDVISVIGTFADIEISTMKGVEEKATFKLPPEFSDVG
ncbi:4-hydroxy-3-methylbut-2-enyl diphosphate reductase [Burkholderia metallica]|uniref:4-hydroxy-3-methylbut-2-enyl diphosphate reductase n=1 Tax=Burkholderia metallica TaxID=488729 RepID=UPI001CF4FE10|nr:4-hydroxy-3-methylbut-2-enyl diphosphate reductase [Burkholderia metallica]MCA8003437.1 4-hydroxy-3-methylbut-2-enyl diphosphate reductase [Burkholderia metallica]